MKPTVISNANTLTTTGSGNSQTGENGGIRIPVKQEYRGPTTNQPPQFTTQAQHYVSDGPHASGYGSPDSIGRCQRQQPPHSQHQQETPARFQDFDFDPDVGLDMFPRTRLGRMTHDPFGDFGSTPRKRTSLHEPHFHTDDFSRYFDDAADFGFPQFNSLGRRRVDHHNDDDFFNRLPSEFRQYIPETFTHRRSGPGRTASPSSGPTKVEQQPTTQQQPELHTYNTIPESSLRKVCDAAIQTEDPTERSEVDHAMNTENLSQHGLRNTMDMGVKSPSEKENQSPRSSSAPPTELQQNLEQPMYTQPRQIPKNGPILQATPPQQQNQFATQTSPQIQTEGYGSQSPQFKKVFYVPQRTQSQQKQQTPPPQTLGGSNIRTIPIFVEGRTEPIINNKEIPNQNATASDTSGAFTSSKQNSRNLPPLNTQQHSAAPSESLPPQTPHTVDTINKIQNIQRDVLDLMSRVEKFTGTRGDKEYVYLDEMLTRNLLKLDNIETNGKESIRLARKEAIKCIQASINVLEAKAEENKKANQNYPETSEGIVEETTVQKAESPVTVAEPKKSMTTDKCTKETEQQTTDEQAMQPADNKSEPIPLPPPESEKFNEVRIEDCPEDDFQTTCATDECAPNPDDTSKNLPN